MRARLFAFYFLLHRLFPVNRDTSPLLFKPRILIFRTFPRSLSSFPQSATSTFSSTAAPALFKYTRAFWRNGSPFQRFMRFADWLYAQTRQTHGIALARLRELVAQYLSEETGLPREQVHGALERDARRTQGLPTLHTPPPRQARHLAKSP